VALLEQMAVPAAVLPKALDSLARQEHLSEVVLLSTCNRTEVYVRATLFHPAVQEVLDFLADQSGIDPDSLSEHLYTYHDDAAVAHLFGVAAGVDSMIVGESEILGQVRESWIVAENEGTTAQTLSRVFRHAVEVGKRTRTETGISRHAASVSSAAVAVAAQRLGSLEGRRVLVVGAGEAGEGMALALAGAGVGEIVVANRTAARAEALATRVGGRAIALEDIPATLTATDVLLASTAADGVLMAREDFEAVMAERDGRALLVVDVAVPRDIDPGVGQVFGVTLLDMDDLKAFAEQSLGKRRQELGRVREIITDELTRYRADRSAREVAPLVVALRARAEDTRLGELERFRSRLAGLDPATATAVEALTQGIVNKLLHEPTVNLKAAAGTARGEQFADALAAMFDLDMQDDEHDEHDDTQGS
jgi:glutamyl-tRNA reductase